MKTLKKHLTTMLWVIAYIALLIIEQNLEQWV